MQMLHSLNDLLLIISAILGGWFWFWRIRPLLVALEA